MEYNPRDGDPYEELANAIVFNAVAEYRKTRSSKRRKEIEAFFRSQWYQLLTKVDGEMLIKRLRKERKAHDRKRISRTGAAPRRANRCEDPAT